MKDTGQIDSTVGGQNVGMIIDFNNQMVDKKREDSFNDEMTSRNKYFWKLWKSAIMDMRNGTRPVQNVYNLKPKKKIGGGEIWHN